MCNVEGNLYAVLCTKTDSADRVKEDKTDGAVAFVRETEIVSRILVTNP
jgi:hypothetical protein